MAKRGLRTAGEEKRSSSLSAVRLEPADPRTLTHSVASTIRSAILEGRLKPGTELVEMEVARQVNVSRSPVREALRQLAEEGLVTAIPFKGTYVTDLSPDSADEVYSLRAALEEFAIRRWTPHMTAEHIASLETIMNRMEKAASRKDRQTVMTQDLAFHREICRLADHELLLKIWEDILFQVLRCINLATYKHDLIDATNDHAATMAALRRHDIEAAANSIREHILEAGERAKNALRQVAERAAVI